MLVVAVLAGGALAWPASAQTGHSAQPGAGAHQGAMHGTQSVHPTPKRQHMMEQMQRAHNARRHGNDQSSETDRLNVQSLQRGQQGEGVAPAGPETTGPAPGASPAAPAR